MANTYSVYAYIYYDPSFISFARVPFLHKVKCTLWIDKEIVASEWFRSLYDTYDFIRTYMSGRGKCKARVNLSVVRPNTYDVTGGSEGWFMATERSGEYIALNRATSYSINYPDEKVSAV